MRSGQKSKTTTAKPPTEAPAKKPEDSLTLEWIHGYRSHDTRNNLHYLQNGNIVYMTAAVGVVYNKAKNEQTYFKEHTDDIISLAVHPEGRIIATGQVGKSPIICVWDSENMQLLSKIQKFHERGVCCLAFTADGSGLISVGLDDYNSVAIWQWKTGMMIASGRGHTDKILGVCCTKGEKFVTVGVKHITFWTFMGNTITGKKGLFGKLGKIQTIYSVAASTVEPNVVYTGTAGGDVYMWNGEALARVKETVHKGGCHAISCKETVVVSGGADGTVIVWNPSLEQLAKFDTKLGVIRGLSVSSNTVLVGTRKGHIAEVSRQDQKIDVLLNSHFEGELWGLGVSSSGKIFATAGDDMKVAVWDVQSKKCVTSRILGEPLRSAEFSPDGSLLAVGTNKGETIILKAQDLSDVISFKDRKEEIAALRFSPDGAYLAVGSKDNFIDMYDVAKNFKKIGTCKGHSSYITHIDWSKDSKYIQSSCGAYELLSFDAATCKQVHKLGGIQWATYSCPLGPSVQGMWPKFADGTDINAVARSNSGTLLATADDFSQVKLFRYPCTAKGSDFKSYNGHSSHVTNVSFTADDRYVISTGGLDQSIFIWKHTTTSSALQSENEVEPEDKGVESDIARELEAGLGSRLSSSKKSVPKGRKTLDDMDDSDPEDESKLRQTRPTSAPPVKQFLGKQDVPVLSLKKPDNLRVTSSPSTRPGTATSRTTTNAGPSSSSPKAKTPTGDAGQLPKESLTLDFVFGYRSYDCRNNLLYTRAGEVIYHAAALGVVYTEASHSQRFFMGHTDDILSIAIHKESNVAATGQVGKEPTICVWDINTLEVLSVLKGFHIRGVSSLSFSADGKKLASIGMDDYNSIAVYDWKKGQLLANNRGGSDKVLFCEYGPNDVLVTGGVKHIKFWKTTNTSLQEKKGLFGKDGPQTLLSAAFLPDGKVVTGTSNGDIIIWTEHALFSKKEAHKGPVFAVNTTPDGYMSGGKDGFVRLWDMSGKVIREFDMNNAAPGRTSMAIRSLCFGDGKIVVGTKSGEIFEIKKLSEEQEEKQLLLESHTEGELWGLATHPTLPICATASDDKTVRLWETHERKLLAYRAMEEELRSCAFSPQGEFLAVGTKKGAVHVLFTEGLRDHKVFKKRQEMIGDIKFSPNGKYLAVGSSDNFVDLYDIEKDFAFKLTCRGCSSYITHIDWSQDSDFIQVCSGAKERLIFDVETGKVVNASTNITWQTYTSTLGPAVFGIWPKGSDITDVNALDRSHSGTYLATADDFSLVKLFSYPVPNKEYKYKPYKGHSSHVTNVRFTHDDQYVVSTGGMDMCVFVWKTG